MTLEVDASTIIRSSMVPDDPGVPHKELAPSVTSDNDDKPTLLDEMGIPAFRILPS